PFSSRKASASSVARRRWPKWTGSKVPPKSPSAFVIGRLLAHVAVPEDDPLLRGEALEPDRAASVKLVRGDADLGAEPVFEAVREARGRVHHDGARVHLAQEALGGAPV